MGIQRKARYFFSFLLLFSSRRRIILVFQFFGGTLLTVCWFFYLMVEALMVQENGQEVLQYQKQTWRISSRCSCLWRWVSGFFFKFQFFFTRLFGHFLTMFFFNLDFKSTIQKPCVLLLLGSFWFRSNQAKQTIKTA